MVLESEITRTDNSNTDQFLFLFSLRCFQILYWNWMQKLKMLYLLLLSTLHTLYLHLLLSLYLQCQDKSLYLVVRHAEAAHRPLGCFQLRRTLCGKHSGTHSKQQAVLASSKHRCQSTSSPLRRHQRALPLLKSHQSCFGCEHCKLHVPFNAAFVVLSKHAFKTRKHRTELGVCQAVFSEIHCQRHSAQ